MFEGQNTVLDLYRDEKRPFFRVDAASTRVLFLEQPLEQKHIDEISLVYQKHVSKEATERQLLESLYFTLASRDMTYERTIFFKRELHSLSLDELYDVSAIQKKSSVVSKETQLHLFSSQVSTHTFSYLQKNDFKMFHSALDFLKNHGGIEQVVKDYHANPKGYRQEIVNEVYGMAEKLASFFYLTTQGEDSVLVLDRHVCRQMANLGVNISEKQFKGHVVTSKNGSMRKKVETPCGKQYLRMESELLDILAQTTIFQEFPELLNEQGNVHGGKLTTLLWWPGVKHHRKLGLQPLEEQHIDLVYTNVERKR